jgi:DNA (cytosine-5)-methyltransferase 1
MWYAKNDNLRILKPTDRKFEWQAGTHIKSVFQGIVQFRPSGIRVKRPTEFPSLVAMVHVPIIGKYKRYITPREAARLQSFPESFRLPASDRLAYQQFGNAVNVEVIYRSFCAFLKFVEEEQK